MRIPERGTAFLMVLGLMALMLSACAPSSADSARSAPRDTVLTVNGTELFVHAEGTGEPVMVIHGGPVLDHGYLVEPLRPLAEQFRLVFHDQRLSGRSAGEVDSASVRMDTLVADIEAIRRALGLGPIHLVGHSWGGLLAMRYATRHPDQLRSLVLLSPMPPTSALWQEEQRVEAAAMAPGDTAGMGYDLREELAGLEVPTLLVYGGEEVGAAIGRDALLAAIPHTTAVAIADAGHLPFMERPGEFIRVVRAFLVGVGAGSGEERQAAEHQELRDRMVERQVVSRGVRDTAVLRAMRTVPRHAFVPEASPPPAYSDRPLPIGHGQTISQPYIVAYMAEAARLEPGDRVLEIGTGSGYGAAVLAELAAEVYTIEIVPELADRAREALERTGYDNVYVRTGNGWLGWPEHAPFDAVVVTAAPDEVPATLVQQLKVDGILVVPVGGAVQNLRVLRKTEAALREEAAAMPVRFVPMVREPPDTGPPPDSGPPPDTGQ